MIRRLDLFGRLMLILLGALILIGTIGVTLFYVREQRRAVPIRPQFPRLELAAGLIDLAATEPASRLPLVIRAGSGPDAVTRILTSEPAASDLSYAPRLTARLARSVRSHVPVRAYASNLFIPRDRRHNVEGFLARAVARLPDGRLLVIDATATGDQDAPRLFGWPASQWMGVAATLVVLLALLGTARETRPLRRLAMAMRVFDGSMVTVTDPLPAAADIRRTAAAALAMQERVVALLGERSLMIGAISHDLRTVLTRMRLRVTALSDGNARIPLERDLERMDAMLSDALAFARGTSAGPARAPVDLADLVASEVAERDARGQDGGIELALDDAICLGESVALRRVIGNLLDNARKYGGGRIVAATGTAGDRAWLTVDDDGPGIAPDQRDTMLRPYRRGEGAHRRGLAGSGLGLAIVGQIVAAHGGSLAIGDSSLGGAKITVWVPAA